MGRGAMHIMGFCRSPMRFLGFPGYAKKLFPCVLWDFGHLSATPSIMDFLDMDHTDEFQEYLGLEHAVRMNACKSMLELAARRECLRTPGHL